MAQEKTESLWEPINYGKLIIRPDIMTFIRRLERIKTKICRQKVSVLFNKLYIHIHVCVFICMYICV